MIRGPRWWVAIIVLVVAAIVAVIFIYRYMILSYSAAAVIRGMLPSYASVDNIKFDFRAGRAVFSGFRIENAPGFSDRYLVEIDRISCLYKLTGKNIPDGLEISDPVFDGIRINIERLGDGRLNLVEMQSVLEKGKTSKDADAQPPAKEAEKTTDQKRPPGKDLTEVIKLPQDFSIRNGSIAFIDRLSRGRPHMITFEKVESNLKLKFADSYTRLVSLSSTGQGNINGNSGEVVNWVMSYDPTAPRLTMSNRFEVTNVDLVSFEPYYDKYSPIVFKSGFFSGTLVFDFDNGSIGSTNEIRISNPKFYIKPGYENAQFWETTVPDIVKYFTSARGDIVFDFKIKGEMSDPKFYLGPISKQAVASMAVDKISSVIQEVSNRGAEGGGRSDLDKVKDYIDTFKGLMKK